MANKELGNTAVCMEEYAWKGLDTFDSRCSPDNIFRGDSRDLDLSNFAGFVI